MPGQQKLFQGTLASQPLMAMGRAYGPEIGWLVGGGPGPLKNDGVKVSWDHEIPN